MKRISMFIVLLSLVELIMGCETRHYSEVRK